MWKNGMEARTMLDPGGPRNQARHWTEFATRFRWLSIAAFGLPVVPPVYWRTATSWAGAAPGGSGKVAGALAAAWKYRIPAPVGTTVECPERRRIRFTNGRRIGG